MINILAFLSAVATVLVDTVRASARSLISGPVAAYATTVVTFDDVVVCQFPLSTSVHDAIRNRGTMKRGQRDLSLEAECREAAAKALEQYECVLLFLVDMGFTEVVSACQQKKFVKHLTVLNMADHGESYLKWKFAHIACLCLNQTEFPPLPSFVAPEDRPDVLIGGAAGRFTRSMTHRKDYRFGWNISQLKKGCPIVRDSAVEAGVMKTIVALSTKQEKVEPADTGIDWETGAIPNIRTHNWVQIMEMKRTTCEIFRKGWYSPQPLYTPSISGHFLTKRKNLGAMGAIVSHRGKVDHLMVLSGTYRPPHVVRGPIRAEELGWNLFGVCPSCKTQFARICVGCGWHPSDSVLHISVDQETEQIVDDSMAYCNANGASALNIVRAVGLKEPFKTRVITGGPEGKYYRSKYIQKSVHSHLRKRGFASLIGETITGERLNSILWDARNKTVEHDSRHFYVSGDYSAATDNLDPTLSNAIAESIADQAGWDSSWKELFVETLTKHRILKHGVRVPKEPTVEWLMTNSLQQEWGQLMGSPTSFPVLCIANLALTRSALEMRYGRKFTLDECGILINGDDIGFVTDQLGYDTWKEITAAGGLSPSLGKNFCSEDFIVLNSTFFDISYDGDYSETFGNLFSPRVLTYRPYINYGLLNCRNENGTPIADLADTLRPSDDPRTPGVGALATDLIHGHPVELQVVLLKRFIANWKPHLDKFCPRGMSYYLPTHLGGLGIPIVGTFTGPDGRGRFSRSQRVLASFLSQDPEKAALLTSSSMIGRSDSLSLWEKVAPRVRKLMSTVGYTWTKDVPSGPQGSGLTAPLLANAYARLTTEDVAEFEDTESENRYRTWRTSYEALFRIAEKSTYAPMVDDEISINRPWRKVYDSYVVADCSPKVDLRSPMNSRLERRIVNPTISIIGDLSITE